MSAFCPWCNGMEVHEYVPGVEFIPGIGFATCPAMPLGYIDEDHTEDAFLYAGAMTAGYGAT